MSKKIEPFNTSMDASHSESGAAILGQMRGSMVAAAESVRLPERFLVTQHAHRPAMIISDLETGRSSTVALCDYRGALELLSDLFGDPKPTIEQESERLGIPVVMELDALTAVLGPSPTERELAYRLEVEGVDAGELGVGRIQIRNGSYHVISTKAWIGETEYLDEAMEMARDEILPLYRGAAYR